MKRRILSILMALCLALTLLPTAAFAVEGQETRVGGTSGLTLEAAAASAKAGDTLVLDSDVEITAQVTIPAGVHLNGQGHTISVGSDTWSTADGAKYMLVCGSGTNVQNVTIDAEGIASGCLQFYKATNSWVLGPVTLKNAKEMGLMINASPSVSASGALTYEGNGWGNTINVGWGSDVTEVKTCSFTANNATMTGVKAIYTDSSDVTNAGDSSKFTIDPPQDFVQLTGENLTQTGKAICYVPSAPVTDGVAEVNGKQYKTLAEALKAANGGTVTLRKDIENQKRINIDDGETVKINLAGHNITFAENSDGVSNCFYITHGHLELIGRGTVQEAEKGRYYSPVMLEGAHNSAANHSTVTVGQGVTLRGWTGVMVDYNASKTSYGVVVNVYGTLNGLNDRTGAVGSGIYVQGTIHHKENRPIINIYPGAVITGTACGVYAAGNAEWNISGGSITGEGEALSVKAGKWNITGGTFLAKGAFVDPAEANGNGSENTGAAFGITSTYSKLHDGSIDVDISGGNFVSQQGTAFYVGHSVSKDGMTYYTNGIDVSITGGTFTGGTHEDAKAVYIAPKVEQDGTYNYSITSGTFSTDPSAYVPTGYAATQTATNTWTVDEKAGGALVVTPDVEGDQVTGTLDGVYQGASTEIEVGGDEDDAPDGSGTANTAGNLVVNLETSEGQTDAASTTLTVETKAAQSLGENKAQSLTLVTDAGSVKLDREALSKMADVTAPVEITVAETAGVTLGGDLAASYTVSVQSGGEDLLPYGDASNGVVEITVDKPSTTDGDDLQAWYAVGQGDSVLYMEELPTDAESVDGKLVIQIRHLSRVDVLKSAPTSTGVAMIGTTPYTSLKDAIEASDGEDDVITLTQPITTLQQLIGDESATEKTTLLSIDANEKITIKGGADTPITIAIPENFADRGEAIQVKEGATLTLDGVTMTIKRDTTNSDRGGDAFDLFGDLVITNASNITVTGVQNAFVMQGGTSANVNVNKGSKVTANDVRGNFSNGGIWNLTNAELDINGCSSYGLSVNSADIKNSKVNIGGVTYAAIIVTNIVENGTQAHEGRLDVYNSQIAITNSGKELPRTESKYGIAEAVIDLGHASGGSQYNSGSEIPNAAARLNVTGDSSITVDDTKGVNGAKVNHIYLTNTADLERDNTSTLPNVVMEAPTADSDMCTVEFRADGVLYQAKQVKVTNRKTDPFGVPHDAPAKNGYTFTSWIAPSGVTEEVISESSGGGSTLSPVEAGKIYVYTARYQSIPVTPVEPDTPSYSGGSSSGETTYSPSLDVSSGGTIKVSPRTPEAGETVTITPMPEAGYDVGTVTVTDRNGREVKVTEQRNSTYIFEQPAGRVTIEVTFVRTGEIVGETPFLDVAPDAWYADAVAYVYENGLMSGTSATAFSPNATTTRGMIVTMLYRLEGEPDVNFGSSFNDVDSTMYYADAVAWASQNGIVTGYDEASFGPNDAITREQMAAILYRYAQYKGYDTAQGGMAIREYDDYAEISEYAQSAMGWAVSEGLVTGTSSTTLTPEGSAVRAQVAAIFMRFMEGRGGVKIQ